MHRTHCEAVTWLLVKVKDNEIRYHIVNSLYEMEKGFIHWD